MAYLVKWIVFGANDGLLLQPFHVQFNSRERNCKVEVDDYGVKYGLKYFNLFMYCSENP